MSWLFCAEASPDQGIPATHILLVFACNGNLAKQPRNLWLLDTARRGFLTIGQTFGRLRGA
jgi:hypothetical protein